MKSSIDAAITECSGDSTQGRAVVCFEKDFPGFQGHFPDHPIAPAVCIVQTALVAIGKTTGRSVRMEKLILAKFSDVAIPGQALRFEWTFKDGVARVNVTDDATGKGTAQLRMGIHEA